MGFQNEKKLVRRLFSAIEDSCHETIQNTIKPFVTDDFIFRGISFCCRQNVLDWNFSGYEPYGGERGVSLHEACMNFWIPVLRAVKNIQRREDIFIAGQNKQICKPKNIPKSDDTTAGDIWVMSMGHFMGLFDGELWGLRPTGKIINFRYTEFHCVKNSKIVETVMFIDSLAVMDAAGSYPLPPSTGQYFVYPGPRNHDGILLADADPNESRKTFGLRL